MKPELPDEAASADPQPLSDLTYRLLGGDGDAVGEILHLLGPKTARIIRARLGKALSDADYDDALAIALARLWVRRSRFDPSRGTLDRWFYALARNAALDILRYRARRPEDAVGDELEGFAAPAPAGTDRDSTLRRDLRELLAQESIANKRIILSRLTESELSHELRLAPGTIRQRRLRIKRRLQSKLREMGHAV